MVNVSYNELHDNQVGNTLRCLMQNFTSATCVEIISNKSTSIMVADTNPEHLPYIMYSSNNIIELSLLQYKFEWIECVLSQFSTSNLSMVILLNQNNGLMLEQIESVINKLTTTSLYVQEPYIQYKSNFVDQSFEFLMNNLLKMKTITDNTLSPFLSLKILNVLNNIIGIYDIKIFNSIQFIVIL